MLIYMNFSFDFLGLDFLRQWTYKWDLLNEKYLKWRKQNLWKLTTKLTYYEMQLLNYLYPRTV